MENNMESELSTALKHLNVNDPIDECIEQQYNNLSEEQISFIKKAVLEKNNITLLAPAGYGKTYVLQIMLKLYKVINKQENDTYFHKLYNTQSFKSIKLSSMPVIQLCASTGKASCLLHCRTLHSLLGIGIGKGTPEEWYARLLKARYLSNTLDILRSVQCIVIDEISMIGSKLLDNISNYLKLIRKNNKVFGGIQIILVGDFAQLHPINDELAFKSDEYKNANFYKMKFTKCFRQNDPVFQNILNELRFGYISEESFTILKNRKSIDSDYLGDLKPTMLRSTNKEVDYINQKELNEICERTNQIPTVYAIKPSEVIDTKIVESYIKILGLPRTVELAIGCQVMITYNISKEIVNGIQGIILQLNKDSVEMQLNNGEIITIEYIGFKDPEEDNLQKAKVLFQYMPLRLATAITIHKSQGSTMQLLEIDCKNIFTNSQLYVAVSRCTDLRGLILKNLSKKHIMCSNAVKQFYGIY